MGDGDRTFHIDGSATFTGSTIANGDVYQGSFNETRYVVQELRDELRERRAEFIRAQPRVEPHLDQLVDELAERKPDKDIVRGGWKAIAKMLTGAGVAAESFQKITELVKQLIGG